MTRRPLLALLAAALVLLGACTTVSEVEEPRVVQPGAPGEPSRELSAEEVAELDIEPPSHNEADVDFMQGMILHHAQALEMSALVPERASMDDLVLFAERMELSQHDEIDMMTTWLHERGEDAPDVDHGHHGHAELMPGMLTDEELAELEASSGADFDRLFLVGMQRHHEGALQMVADLFAAGGGEEPEMFQFANHVDTDQRIELGRIAVMLAELEGSG